MTKPTRKSRSAAYFGRHPRVGAHESGGRPAPEHVLIYGFHAVEAALKNEWRSVQRVLASEAALTRLAPLLAGRGLSAEPTAPKDLDRRAGPEAVHQGAMIEALPLPEPDLSELCAARPGQPPPLLIVLDQVTDPHNVGAILRSAAVFGAAGLLMTRQHSPPLTGALAKAASGALEHVPVCLVGNLARTLEELADHGVQRLGLDGEGTLRLEDQRADRPTALVLGAEGKGLRRLTREKCDALCRISTFGPLASLNVSNAAAVALHALRTR